MRAKRARASRVVACGCLALAFLVAPAVSQGPAGGAPGVREDLLASYDGATRRLLRLADAMPADHFSWRPAEGVRSFAQVLMHVAEGSCSWPSTPTSTSDRRSPTRG
jgi:hypothetical protein